MNNTMNANNLAKLVREFISLHNINLNVVATDYQKLKWPAKLLRSDLFYAVVPLTWMNEVKERIDRGEDGNVDKLMLEALFVVGCDSEWLLSKENNLM